MYVASSDVSDLHVVHSTLKLTDTTLSAHTSLRRGAWSCKHCASATTWWWQNCSVTRHHQFTMTTIQHWAHTCCCDACNKTHSAADCCTDALNPGGPALPKRFPKRSASSSSNKRDVTRLLCSCVTKAGLPGGLHLGAAVRSSSCAI